MQKNKEKLNKYKQWLKKLQEYAKQAAVSFGNAQIAGDSGIATSVAIASGYRYDPSKKKWVQDQQNYPDVKALRDNLFAIGEAAITAPTAVDDVVGLYNIIRHPIQSYKTMRNLVKDGWWFLKNPQATKVYHGVRSGNKFNIKDAKTASPMNIGLHVTPNKNIAKAFNKDVILEAYIPKHNIETIDIGFNDYNLLSNKKVFPKRPKGSGSFYDNAGKNEFQVQLLKKHGAEPSINDYWGNSVLNTEKDVIIPLRKETWKHIPRKADDAAENLLLDISTTSPTEFTKEKAIQFNQRANDIFSNNNVKVIKYNNVNPYEGGGGVSYIVTDPSVFYQPKSNLTQLRQYTSLGKYPFIINSHD